MPEYTEEADRRVAYMQTGEVYLAGLRRLAAAACTQEVRPRKEEVSMSRSRWILLQDDSTYEA